MTTDEYVKALVEQNSELVIDLMNAVYETGNTKNHELLKAIDLAFSYFTVTEVLGRSK